MKPSSRILLTGATGYVGGRLLPALENGGYRVRCLARRPEYLEQRVGPMTEVVQADCLDGSTLEPAMEGVDAAYYMIHSMGSSGNFADLEKATGDQISVIRGKGSDLSVDAASQRPKRDSVPGRNRVDRHSTRGREVSTNNENLVRVR